MSTKTTQVRKALYLDDIEKFQIEASVTDVGALPSARIFVMEIMDTTNPKADIFARVATLADFDEIQEDRNVAVAAGETFFRSSALLLYYDTLDTAVAAQDVLKSRVDELVEAWDTYALFFVTVSEETTHPRYHASTFENAVADYQAALTAQAAALSTRDAAKTAYDTAVSDAASAATAVTTATTQYNTCITLKGYFQTLYDAMKDGNTGFYGQSVTFLNAAAAYLAATQASFPTQAAIFTTAFNTFVREQAVALAAIQQANSHITGAFATQCNTLLAAITTAQGQLATAQTAVATKRTAYEDAQAAYAAAQKASDAALAVITALKPDYDPTST